MFCKPVHVASVRTDSALPFDEAEHWHVTEEEWMCESGRARAQGSERCRRDETEYGRALESLSGAGRRKSATTTFVEYAGAMLRTLAVRAAELTSVARSAGRGGNRNETWPASSAGCVTDSLTGRRHDQRRTNHPPKTNHARRHPSVKNCDAS